jgi:hypothetical protein
LFIYIKKGGGLGKNRITRSDTQKSKYFSGGENKNEKAFSFN